MIILNCDKDERISGIFEQRFRTEKILSDIEINSGQNVTVGRTLIFIDEVQAVPV